MPPTHAPAGRPGPAPPARRNRWRGRVGAAAAAAAVAAGPLALGQLALPQAALAQPARGQQAAAPRARVSVVIEAVSPQWARPGHTVTVTGIVTNNTTVPQDGTFIQLRSSGVPLGDRDDLSAYAAGDYPVDMPEGPPVALPAVIAPGRSVRWQATLSPAAAGMTAFGVYPLAAQLLDGAGVPVATDRTFLPFWPGGAASQLPRQLSIAWVWPLFGQPYRLACGALLSNGLAGSLAGGGRLAGLLAAGRTYSAAAQLTWAIDPALVQTVRTMASRYSVGGNAECAGATTRPADPAARDWLRGLVSASSGQHVLLAPYADVDVAALSHDGLDADLQDAFAMGRSVGSQILHPAPGSTAIAWPQGGLADAGVLGSLAVNKITTVVLDSTVMPPAAPVPSYTPSAQATAASGVGSSLHVLLADHTISQLLAGPAGSAAVPGAAFATEQQFLAQTAMIVAEAPALARSLVVAPPRLWDPAPGLAAGLLSETVTAPWLKPASLAALAAVSHPAGQVPRRPPPAHQVSKGELGQAYLRQVASLDTAIRLQASIIVPRDTGYLTSAVAALESSDWPGDRAQAAATRQAQLGRVRGYVSYQSTLVSIIDSAPRHGSDNGGPEQITLGGSSGRVPVSVSNDLRSAVRVTLHASAPSDGRLAIGPFNGSLTIPAGKTMTVRVPVRASTVGATDMTLSLLAPDGSPLPGTTVKLTVHASRFGTLALVIMSVALGVFVLTSAARAIRRARRDGGTRGRPPSGPRGPAPAPGSVRSGDDLAHDQPPEDPDEYADARGRARR